jgi:hypothetical protein
MACARDKKSNPYPATFGTLDGVPWDSEVRCGHNPFLFARRVDDLTIETDVNGNEKATWTERERPNTSWRRDNLK